MMVKGLLEGLWVNWNMITNVNRSVYFARYLLSCLMGRLLVLTGYSKIIRDNC
jgi:hypothetical protein